MDQELTEELTENLEVQLLINLRKLFKEQLFFLNNNSEEIKSILVYLDNLPKYENTSELYLENFLKHIDEQIKNKCQHNYVTDDIDIDPEKSIKICYCSICEHTK
jgi:hypothetical protein